MDVDELALIKEILPGLVEKVKPREVLAGDGKIMESTTQRFQRAGSPFASEAPGGIDLNPQLLDLQIKRDGRGVPLPLPEQPLHQMQIDGFTPIIINISPIPSLPLYLGMGESDGEERDFGLNPELDPLAKRNRYYDRQRHFSFTALRS